MGFKKIIYFLLSLTCFHSLYGANDQQFKTQVLACLEGNKCNFQSKMNSLKPEDFSYNATLAVIADAENRFDDVVSILSNALTQINYGADWDRSSGETKAFVGAPMGFSFWRELSYLLLGRAYYNQKNYPFAEKQLKGIPSNSVFFAMGSIELFWTFVAQHKTESLQSLYDGLKAISLSKELTGDVKVIEAYLSNASGETKKALDLLLSVAFDKSVSAETKELAFNLYADYGFTFWHKNFVQLSENDRIRLLKEIIDASEQISKSSCHEECQFFSAEAWWNLATLYRIIDPVSHEKDVKYALGRADLVLSHSMNLAIKLKQTNLREDAFFLGVVISWERNDIQNAIKRSLVYDKIFPVGRYREDVYQLMADYYFENKDYQKALNYYQFLVKVGGLEKSTYGMFKAAWSFYNLNQKWSALRHLERIVIASKNVQSDESYHLGVLNESKRDMLLFLAELTTFPEALEELTFLESDNGPRNVFLQQLAATYKLLGRFDQSSLTYLFLLDQSKKDTKVDDYFSWLSELLDNQLRLRNFKNLRENYTHYIKRSLDVFGNEAKITSVFFDFIDSLTTTLHREAKRIVDQDLWQTVDFLYDATEKQGLDKSSFSFLYFGAQRFEENRDLLRSMSWYRAAASIKSDNQLDSALSGLRLCKQLVDSSLETGVMSDIVAASISDYSIWFKKSFSSATQTHLADYLYFEVLLTVKKYQKLIDDFSLLIVGKDPSDDSFKLFSSIANRLYKLQQWRYVYALGDSLKKSCPSSSCKYYREISRVMEETAFQEAYTNIDKSKSVEWYLRTVSINHNKEIVARAWYNLILLTLEQSDLETVEAMYSQFEKYFSLNPPKTPDVSQLLFDGRVAVAKFYFTSLSFLRSAEISLLADSAYSEQSNQNKIINYSTYFSFFGEKGRNVFESLPASLLPAWDGPKYDQYQRFKMYFNVHYDQPRSFELKKTLSPFAIFNLYDDLYRSKEHSFSWWCSTNKSDCSQLLSTPLGQSFALKLFPLETQEWDEAKFNKQFNELESGVDADRQVVEQQIISFIKILDQSSVDYSKFVVKNSKSPYFHFRGHAACEYSKQQLSLLNEWRRLFHLVNKVFPDWKELLALLEDRIKSTVKTSNSLTSTCDNAQEKMSLFYVSTSKKFKELLWPKRNELVFVPHGSVDDAFIKSILLKHPKLFDRIYYFLSHNLPMVAEYFLSTAAQGDELTLGLALWRLYYDDPMSTYSLISELKATSDYYYDGQVLLAIMRYQNRHPKLFYLPPPALSGIKSDVLKLFFEEIND